MGYDIVGIYLRLQSAARRADTYDIVTVFVIKVGGGWCWDRLLMPVIV